MTEEQKKSSPKKHRSPNYPYVGLEEALKKAQKVLDVGRTHFVPFAAAMEAWEYKAAGTVHSVIAALKAYSLIEVQGEGDKKEVKVSEAGRKILDNHSDRPALLKEAALNPTLHKELWERYHGDLPPSDKVISEYLKYERNFNPTAVGGFIDQFRKTIAFANLSHYDKIDNDSDSNDLDDNNKDASLGNDDVKKKKLRHQPKDGEIVEELNFKLAPDSRVSLVFTSTQKVTQEDFDLLMKMLELQKVAFPTAEDIEKENAAADRRKRIIPEF